MSRTCEPLGQVMLVVTKFEFCTHLARLLRKLDHFLLWSDSMYLCRVKNILMTSNVLPFHFAPWDFFCRFLQQDGSRAQIREKIHFSLENCRHQNFLLKFLDLDKDFAYNHMGKTLEVSFPQPSFMFSRPWELTELQKCHSSVAYSRRNIKT